ncbi:ribonuclease P protein component [Antrihabitans sp. YC3-6]|uniref:Ribonuclease P protein component n=1 Tax=Antrihabitans stalagmiti TaxID=2799499 RepID=A0A934NW92_9NOCA|nr:ribonuclease P protein component [Antrihabitans stalagmiti]MBJ8342561.1 ribonuclease P protein component [Antrihabitans stalagmiti]
MLPEPHRLHHHADFSRTVRRGHRIGRRDLVVHIFDRNRAADDATSEPVLGVGGLRMGLIVSKTVGNAVTRHRVARRLRHSFHSLIDDVDLSVDVVVRALPSAASASSADLERQLRAGLSKVRQRSMSPAENTRR